MKINRYFWLFWAIVTGINIIIFLCLFWTTSRVITANICIAFITVWGVILAALIIFIFRLNGKVTRQAFKIEEHEEELIIEYLGKDVKEVSHQDIANVKRRHYISTLGIDFLGLCVAMMTYLLATLI